MKLRHLSIAMLACLALTYAACKKSGSSATVDAKTVSSQVALNLAQTLYSGYGGFNVTSGLSAPGTFGVDRDKIRLNLTKGRLAINDVGDDITCGLQADTTFSTSVAINGVNSTVSGSIGFKFNCTNGTPSGFTETDALKITESGAQSSGTISFNEDLTMTQVTPGDDNSTISLNGTAGYDGALKVSGKATSESYNYTFNQVILNQDGTIASGSATFNTKGSNGAGSWSYNGTVTFLGNGQVKIVINGATYNVNLQTGVVG
ncbi:MAG TPA: hypothetical protein VGM63_19520 [Mucilaginibacter sp.]|jgi:hypothetical protein